MVRACGAGAESRRGDCSVKRKQQDLRCYADALAMWQSRRFDTAEIADHLRVPEHVVCRWINNYREVMTGAAA